MGHEDLVGALNRGSPEQEKIQAGPLDIILIYHKLTSNTYHAVYYKESSLLSSVATYDEVDAVCLKSEIYHTEGSRTLEGAQQQVAELREKIEINDLNVYTEHPMAWDGKIDDVIVLPNWRKRGEERDIATILG